LFCVAEEIYGLGSKSFSYSIIKSKESYTLDLSGDVGSAAYKAPTLISFKITVHGKAAHAGSGFDKGIHAINIASDAITKTKMGLIDDDSTCNIGVINGGLAGNIVPESCVVEGEIRSYSHEKSISILEEITEIFSDSAKNKGGSVSVDHTVHIEAYETPLDHPVVKRFEEVCKGLNIIPHLRATFGGSDNNHLEKHGINGLVLASGIHNSHSTEEYTYISELEKITQITIELMRNGEYNNHYYI
jgi:tripeptide aminopeptidase